MLLLLLLLLVELRLLLPVILLLLNLCKLAHVLLSWSLLNTVELLHEPTRSGYWGWRCCCRHLRPKLIYQTFKCPIAEDVL